MDEALAHLVLIGHDHGLGDLEGKQTGRQACDREGLDAFSLPRLARELSVQTPSLYYHFRDRADILRTVARAERVQAAMRSRGAP